MYTAYANDRKMSYEEGDKYFAAMDGIALQSYRDYIGFESTDVSDVSLEYDQVASYRFTSSASAIKFQTLLNKSQWVWNW